MQDEINRIRGPVIHLGDEMLVSNPMVRGPLRLQLYSLVRHAHITGTTGSGKSNTAKVICSGLLDNGIPTVILDRNGEYAEEFGGKEKVAILRPGENLSIALFSLEGEDREAQIADRLSLLNHFYIVCYNQELSPLQGRVVREALSRHYRGSKETLTVSRLIEVLERLMKEAENRGGWPESIEAAISRL